MGRAESEAGETRVPVVGGMGGVGGVGGMGDMPRGNETFCGGGGCDGDGDGDGDGDLGGGDHGEGEGVGLHADYAAINVNIFIGPSYAGDTHPPHPPPPPITGGTGEKRPQGGNPQGNRERERPQGGNPQGNTQGNPGGGNRRDDPHSEPHGGIVIHRARPPASWALRDYNDIGSEPRLRVWLREQQVEEVHVPYVNRLFTGVDRLFRERAAGGGSPCPVRRAGEKRREKKREGLTFACCVLVCTVCVCVCVCVCVVCVCCVRDAVY